MCGKFGLMSHIDGSALVELANDLWVQADRVVRSWLLGSVADDVLDLAMTEGQNARALWLAIEGLFNDNKESRAIFLSNQFLSMVQGDLPILEYYQHLKTLADSLRDVSHPVSEPQLVLNLLRDLNSHYSNTAENIANSTPFPSFAKARSMLSLKELRLANKGAPQWRPPPSSILGPYPQAHTVFTPPPAFPPNALSWDQGGLIAAMNQMALQGPDN
ncbi:uncharacterized protein LOC133930196 [Phragmites australis]|uniref:uncharacterized protein LOC133930196 n=1 Tax=Phragmites australis TaxID=29695 RepID=UPI002D782D67|nr:uncharacterized protein LOC133930196 [Phragmites australis]